MTKMTKIKDIGFFVAERGVWITAVGNMKIHVRLRYVLSFGEKVSGSRNLKSWNLTP